MIKVFGSGTVLQANGSIPSIPFPSPGFPKRLFCQLGDRSPFYGIAYRFLNYQIGLSCIIPKIMII
jgi:hypothetical protein